MYFLLTYISVAIAKNKGDETLRYDCLETAWSRVEQGTHNAKLSKISAIEAGRRARILKEYEPQAIRSGCIDWQPLTRATKGFGVGNMQAVVRLA